MTGSLSRLRCPHALHGSLTRLLPTVATRLLLIWRFGHACGWLPVTVPHGWITHVPRLRLLFTDSRRPPAVGLPTRFTLPVTCVGRPCGFLPHTRYVVVIILGVYRPGLTPAVRWFWNLRILYYVYRLWQLCRSIALRCYAAVTGLPSCTAGCQLDHLVRPLTPARCRAAGHAPHERLLAGCGSLATVYGCVNTGYLCPLDAFPACIPTSADALAAVPLRPTPPPVGYPSPCLACVWWVLSAVPQHLTAASLRRLTRLPATRAVLRWFTLCCATFSSPICLTADYVLIGLPPISVPGRFVSSSRTLDAVPLPFAGHVRVGLHTRPPD